MDYTTLGRTGLDVSVVGLGCGGHSRLGQAKGASEDQSVALVKAAIDLGITFLDTATAYGTEKIVGRAIAGQRDKVVISTKEQIVQEGSSPQDSKLISGVELKHRVEASLQRLNTDYIDILHLHGVGPHQYDHCLAEFAPALDDLKTKGKIRFSGITERFIDDPSHTMLDRAIKDDCWDVMMVGFNLLNPSATRRVFPKTLDQKIGTLCMFAVRRALSNPEALCELIIQLNKEGLLNRADFNMDNPLEFLVTQGGAKNVVDGAYRYCRHTPGIDVILTGTSKLEHLKQNIASINNASLNPACLEKLDALFGKIDTVSGN